MTVETQELTPQGVEPQVGTAPETQLPAEGETQPQPQTTQDPYRWRSGEEETELDRSAVDRVAEDLGWRPNDVLRALGGSRHIDRLSLRNQQREEALNAREQQLADQIRQLDEFRRAAQGFDPNQLDPNVRVLYDRLGALEGGLTKQLETVVSRIEAREQEDAMREEVSEHYESINSWAKDQGFPTFGGQQFFREMLRSGLAASGMPWEDACVLNYQAMAFKALSKNGQKPKGEPQKIQPMRPRTQISVPAAPSVTQAPRDDTQPVPGETLEQKRDRLHRAIEALGQAQGRPLTFRDAHPGAE